MVEVRLPFSALYVCEICGRASDIKEQIVECEAVSTWETPDVQIGERVNIHGKVWRGDRYVGLSFTPEIWRVKSLFYAQPGASIGWSVHDPRPRPHQLCVELVQGPHEGIWSSFQEMLHEHLLLWRKGDPQRLAAAGLIELPKRRTLLGIRR